MYSSKYVWDLSQSRSIDFDAPDKHGNTALLQACYAQNMDVIKTLISLGVDINKPNALGMTPLMYAIYLHQEQMIQALLQAGADTEARLTGLNCKAIAENLGFGELQELLG